MQDLQCGWRHPGPLLAMPGLGSEREDRLRDCLTRADQWSADCDLSVEGRRGIQSLVRIILVPAAQQRDKDPTIRNWPPELFNIGLFPSAWYQALRTFATLHNPDASPRAKKKSPEWLGHVILDSILDSGFRMWSLRTDKLRVLWADSPERHHLDFDRRGRAQWKKAVSWVIGARLSRSWPTPRS